MPVNAHPEYIAAEKEYLSAYSLEDKIEKLKAMISLAPSHKGAENLRAELKTRLKKLLEKQQKDKKSRKGKPGIKKEDMQAVILGFTNSGKSTLLSSLTNSNPEISEFPFTTKQPKIGMMNYNGVLIQLIENPAIGSEFYDKGLTNSADVLLIIINRLEDLPITESKIGKINGKEIIVFNNKFGLDERKLSSTLQSKKYNYVISNDLKKENLGELKEKIFQSFGKIRVFTKEPGKEKSPKPVILNPGSTVKKIAEKILKGFSSRVKETKIWGPSSKFPGQKVGLSHVLKDLDVVEFKTG